MSKHDVKEAEASKTWIFRDGDDLVCHCRCKDAPMGNLPQMDCPWCGCGWLFTCLHCDKAFMFGVIRAVTPDELQRIAAVAVADPGSTPDEDEIADFLEFMGPLVDHPVGTRVVILDGVVIPVDYDEPVEFEGLYATHSYPWVPHVKALEDPSVIDEVLANEELWRENAVEQD